MQAGNLSGRGRLERVDFGGLMDGLAVARQSYARWRRV